MWPHPGQGVVCGLDEWKAQTQSQLHTMQELRAEVRSQFKRADQMSESSVDRELNLGGPAVEDKLKKRNRQTQNLTAAIASNMETIQQIIFSVRKTVQDLARGITLARAALSVVDLRIELRTQRPSTELIEDSFNEALQQEHAVLRAVISELAAKCEASQEFIVPLQHAKDEMHANRLIVHLDRTGATQQLLDHVVVLEKGASQFCREAAVVIKDTGARTKKALAKTNVAMKQRIAATLTLKEQIEKDLKETRRTIAEAELYLERLEKELKIQLAVPERHMSGMDFQNKKLATNAGAIGDLRAKIKAAAYTGTNGRQLSVLFSRFDRDGSGALDEEEVRRAFRRTLRIPPSSVTDAEISSLCALLDEDRSGTVSISEIVDFICADVDVDSLEQQCNAARDAIANLKAAQHQSHQDLRNKVSAWKIDVACSRANPIKGLKLDSARSTRRPETAGLASLGKSDNQYSPKNALDQARHVRPLTSSISGTAPKIDNRYTVHNAPGTSGSARKVRPNTETLPALPNSARDQSTSYQTYGLDSKMIETLRSKVKAAANTMHTRLSDGSSDLREFVYTVFVRFEGDEVVIGDVSCKKGKLCEDEVKQALRKELRISQSMISDAEISALCKKLDVDKCGGVSVDELVAFVMSEPDTKRNSKAFGQLANARQSNAPDESAGP